MTDGEPIPDRSTRAPAVPRTATAAGNAADPVPVLALPTRQRLAVYLVSTGAFVVYVVDAVLRQHQFKTSIDITIFQQAIANYAQGNAPTVLIKSQQPFNILGDHFSPILLTLAPFYRMWPSVITLLVAQALLLAVGVHVVTRVAVRRLGVLGYYIGAAFALSWGILKVVDFDFHEACFVIALLALALEALLDERLGRMLAWCALLLLAKEDTPLYIAGIALVLAVAGRWRWAAGLLAGSVLAFWLLLFQVIPRFSYYGAYTYIALGGGETGLPGMAAIALGNLFSVNGLALLGALGITAAFGLRSPLILVMLPTLLARFASQREVYLEMKFYYDGPLMVICFLALVVALQQRRIRLGRTPEQIRAWWTGASGRAAGVVLLVLMVYNIQTTELPKTLAESAEPDKWQADARRLIDEIPAGATVIADVGLLGNMADRHPVLLATKSWTDSTNLPLDADWVFLHIVGADDEWKRARVQQLAAEGYRQINHSSRLVVLTR